MALEATKNQLFVGSIDDCNDLCAILARNGYYVKADQIPANVSAVVNPPSWVVSYCPTPADTNYSCRYYVPVQNGDTTDAKKSEKI